MKVARSENPLTSLKQAIDHFAKRLYIVVQEHLDVKQAFRFRASRGIRRIMAKKHNNRGFGEDVRRTMRKARSTKLKLDLCDLLPE